MEIRKECYEVGALLYSPALNEKIAESLFEEKYGKQFSLALCLEDTVAEAFVPQAEEQLHHTLLKILEKKDRKFYLPKIFIRVRDTEQLDRVHELIKDCNEIVTGYIFPKYTISNGSIYNRKIREINQSSSSGKKFYMMPILESGDLMDYESRRPVLLKIKKMLDSVKEYVLNIRVGGNDFCNIFSVRRQYHQSIYDILPIANVVSDILTVFLREYVISGPVWEFFSSEREEWKEGLQREVELDRLNGLVGKTVIHPKQIAIVNECFKVSWKDYQDAKEILNQENWKALQVAKGAEGERMNERKTHENWAKKTMILAKVYGIKVEEKKE